MGALRGSSVFEPAGGAEASSGVDASVARGGGVAVGGGGAPPAHYEGTGMKATEESRAGGPSSDASAGGGPSRAAPADGAAKAAASQSKRVLAALALGLCAVGLAVGSGADFFARTANPSNVFSAGSLSMQNSKDGTAILDAAGMKPGAAPKTGVVDIQNTGSISGRFSLSRDQLTNTDVNNDNPTQFAAKVAVGVVDCGKFATTNGPYGPVDITPTCGDQDDQTLSLGSLAAQNGEIALGTYEPGEKHRYDFEASLDQSVGNEYSGDGSSARYVFDAKQTP
jgi:hypothetical protein